MMGLEIQHTISPLVITPPPLRHESLKGYIIRVTEMNGYSTPNIMLSAAGMNANEKSSIIPPLEKLAPLLNTNVSELKKLGYRRPNGMTSAKHIWINNHQLPTYYLNIKSPKICNECIVEKGFAESFWDLKYAIACPKHGRLLMKSCPNCNKQLSWNRPGLLICKCGYDLSQHKAEQLNNPAVLGLLGFMRNQLMRDVQDFKLLESKLGFPVEHLKSLTLGELLSFITKLENKSIHLISVDPVQKDEFLLIKTSQVLKNWPNGFYECLDSFKEQGASLEGFGLRKQFESFCGSLFKSDIPHKKMAFIKNALIEYGNHHWKQGYIFNGQDNPRKVVGIYGLAKVMGVMPSTAKNLVSRGWITGKTSKLNGRTRHFFDINHDLPFKSAVGKTFTLRKAAAWLELPKCVLKILRELGEFEVNHIAKPFIAYHELDLMVFRDRLLKTIPTNSHFIQGEHITLKNVLQMKTGLPQIKANFVKAILNSEFKPLGSIDGSVKGMIFPSDQVRRFVEIQRRSLSGCCTVVQAAEQLHCDPLVVKRLALDEILLSVLKPNGLFIENTSITDFGSKYISCAYIAKKYKTSSQKILAHCSEGNLSIMWFPRYGNNKPQPFMDITSSNTLCELMAG